MLPYREISADKWADGNLLKLKWKSNVLHMGRTKPMHQYRLWTNKLESSLAEKDLGT